VLTPHWQFWIVSLLQYFVAQKNSATPLFALFKMCGTVPVQVFFDILYELPEGGNI
jgi:hypothetical protein